jgi:integrase
MSSVNRPHMRVPLSVLASNFPSRFLLNATIQPRTLQLYTTATACYIRWYQIQPGAFSSVNHVDKSLCDYVTLLFLSDVSMSYAHQTVFGLIHFVPELGGELHRTRRALKGWKKKHKTRSHPPLSWELVCMLAVQMSAVGWYEEALATLVSYDGYFRTASELLQLKVRNFHHIVVRRDMSHNNYVCRLARTKTGRNKLVTLTMPDIGAALLSFIRVRGLSPSDRIFNFPAARYRHRFKLSCEMLGWQSVRFVPHSMRHGHASDDFIEGIPIETIMVRGRWKSIESTRHYIQSGRVHLIRGQLPSDLPILPDYTPKRVLELLQHTYLHSLSQ